MPFPSVASRTLYDGAGSSSSHSLPYGTLNAGDLLLVIYSNAQTGAITLPGDMTELDTAASGSGRVVYFAKEATGSESGNFALTHGNTGAAAVLYRILAGTWSGNLGDIAIATPVTGTSSAPNAPSLDAGSVDSRLWLAGGGRPTDVAATSAPTNYGNLQSAEGFSQAMAFCSERELEAQTENPGTTGFSGNSADFVVTTIGIPGIPPITATGASTAAAQTAAAAAQAIAAASGSSTAPAQVVASSATLAELHSIVSSSPAHGANGVATDTTIQITFNKNMVVGSGNITLRSYVTGLVVAQWDVSGPNVDVTGPTVTITPSSDLSTSVERYYVEFDAGAIEDTFGNPYAGFSGKDTLNFSCSIPNGGKPLVVSNRLLVRS